MWRLASTRGGRTQRPHRAKKPVTPLPGDHCLMRTRRYLLAWTIALACLANSDAAEVLDIGGQRELFVDHYLVERLDGAMLKLGEPRPAGVAVRYDQPWEGPLSFYTTVF